MSGTDIVHTSDATFDADVLESDTPAKFNIRGIPSLLLFKHGAVAATQVGAVSKPHLRELLERHLTATVG
jgi:thioredoxin-like negative regulator of GroEL